MTNTEKIAKLMAKARILEDEMAVNTRVAAAETESLTAALGEATEIIYNNDMDVINQ